MNKILHPLFLTVCIKILFLAGCTSAEKKPAIIDNRIISLSPHITEILYNLGAKKNIIAVTDFCLYPEQAKAKEKIGGLLNPNIEKIVVLKPTHIFGIPAHAELANTLDRFGLKITMFPNENISDYLATVEKIGSMLGMDSAADSSNRVFMDSLKVYSGSANDPVSAVLLIGREPGSLRNITVAGPETFISELWKMAGGINIYSDLEAHYATVTIESLFHRNPQAIIELSSSGPEQILRLEQNGIWQGLKGITAVEQDQIYQISASYTMIPGPRMIYLARDFAHIMKRLRNEKRVHANIYR